MNIFYLDESPRLCAKYLYDKHMSKMTVETAQMLSTALRRAHADSLPNHNNFLMNENSLYRETHANHPCTKWVGETRANFIWTLNLGFEIADEFEFRYKKVHATKTKCLIPLLHSLKKNLSYIPKGGLTNPPQCVPDAYKCDDPIKAYRAYYAIEKANLRKYTSREQPEWILDYSNGVIDELL